jgi:hypothetical protein
LSQEVSNIKKWDRLYSVNEGLDYFFKIDSLESKEEFREFLVKFQFRNPKTLSQNKFINDELWIPSLAGYVNLPVVKSIVIKNKFDCKNETYVILKESYYDQTDRYVFLRNVEINKNSFFKISESGAFRDLFRRVCNN